MIQNHNTLENKKKKGDRDYIKIVLQDYYMICLSREASLIGRREVLTGKAKFGILGDGKELPQIALAKVFEKGDWRSGYYRDQTFMLAIGEMTIEDYFAQLYADADHDPFSAGRQMNSHFASPTIDENGDWLDLTERYNISSDISCTGGQMARGVGLAFASQKLRAVGDFPDKEKLSKEGREICFVTIGDASTSEGIFWETLNAAVVNHLPMVVCVWDDGFGISVPTAKQTAKSSISKAVKGFGRDEDGDGMIIRTVKGWDYPSLCATFKEVADAVRNDPRPALIHVEELTQPQGHSTSGSHERYKNKERLEWEKTYDCVSKMREWILRNNLSTEKELDQINEMAKAAAKKGRDNAWERYFGPVKKMIEKVKGIYEGIEDKSDKISALANEFKSMINPFRGEILQNLRRLKRQCIEDGISIPGELKTMVTEMKEEGNRKYDTHLYVLGERAAINIPPEYPVYSAESPVVNGYQIINDFFDKALEKYPNMIAFGEDVGKIGDVNQGFAGLQEKYGEHRVFDTGIREWTIMGGAIGAAIRGLRPIAEIQYIDYLLYGLTPLADDLATLRYRSNGIQKAPAIIRTRGHRLEGIWHAGSPMGMMINSLRGIYIAVPRNMVQAAGFYATFLKSDDPAIVVECLNGYRLKEQKPDNLGDYCLPIGVPEVLVEGTDVTLVTYGSCVRVAQKALDLLDDTGISVELIDVQTLLPFDLEHHIAKSLQKTNKIIFLDEDLPGGATGFMMREVLEVQGGYKYLDAPPVTVTAKDHRTPFGSDGDYFTKPNPEDVCDALLVMMAEYDPAKYVKYFSK